VAPRGGQVGAVGEGAAAKLVDMNTGAPIGGGAQAGQQPAAQAPEAMMRQEIGSGLQKVQQITPPSVYGRMGLNGLAQQIEKAMPQADPLVKMMTLEYAQKLLAPDAKMQWELYKQQHDETFQKEMTMFRHRLQVDEPTSAPRLLQDAAGNLIEHKPGQPIPPGAQLPIPGSAHARASKNVEITNAEGQKIFSGAAHQDATGKWVSDKDQKVLEIPDDANISIAGSGGAGGRQGEQQQARITSAGNLLSAELGNLMQLPAMSTASIFQGVEAGPGRHLGESLQRSLAAKLTPETATDLATTYQGVARAVAALESGGAATGLVGLTESSKVYQPMPTDTVGNVMRKFATLRQILERGLESAATARDVTPERKKLYEKIKQEVEQSVPFTVEDVTKLSRGDEKTYRQMFEAMQKREGGSADASGDAIPVPPELATYPDGYGF
jgi:hypothetical protein